MRGTFQLRHPAREDRVHTSGTAGKRTPAILAQALYGLPPLNRQCDVQLLPYPSHYLIARKLNEPKLFLRGLCGLRGSKYKKPINAIYGIYVN
jgi:hypothetical protein